MEVVVFGDIDECGGRVFCLRPYCALRRGEMRDALSFADPSFYAPTAPFGRAGAVSARNVLSWRSPRKYQRNERGRCPSTPLPSARLCSASLRRACGVLDNEIPPSWAHNCAPKMGVAQGWCLYFSWQTFSLVRGLLFRGACFEDGEVFAFYI